jgi:hypothetical protein
MLMLILIPAIMSAIGVVREGDRLDRQFPLDADQPLRIPVRQAIALYRVAMGSFAMLVLIAETSSRCRSSGAGSGAGDPALCLGDDRLRPAHLQLHAHAGRGRLRHRHPVDHPGGQFLSG